MNEDRDKEMRDLRGKIADDLGYQQKNQDPQRHTRLLDVMPDRKFLILGGVGIFLLMVLIALLSGGGDRLPAGDLNKILVRLDRLEDRLIRLEGVADRVDLLEKQEKDLRQSIVETDRSGRGLTQRLDKLAGRFDSLQKRIASAEARANVLPSIQRKPASLAKRLYHEVRSGDSLYRIARQHGISVDELCRLNDITREQVIYPGQRLLVAPTSGQ